MCVRIQPCVMAESFFSLSVVLTANYYLATKRGQLAGADGVLVPSVRWVSVSFSSLRLGYYFPRD